MKSEIINYLLLVVMGGCLVLNFSSSFVTAQSFDNPPKVFGYSLQKTEKKNKDKAKITASNKTIAHENIPVNDDTIIRVDTIMVLNEVLVFDQNGNYVKDLKKEDFTVREDNQSQEINTFLTGDSETIPRSIVLIIDHSFSQLPYLETSIEATKTLVDKLNPKDRMAIVTDDVELLQNFTTDKILLKDKLETLKNSALVGRIGQSKQYSALMATLNEMFDDKTLRPIIIFQTDGDQLDELKGEIANSVFQNIAPINFSYHDILTACEKMQATIYTVIPGISFNNISKKEKLERARTIIENDEKFSAKIRNVSYYPSPQKILIESLNYRVEFLTRNQLKIEEIAKQTGGVTDYLEQPEQADKIYSEILSRMNRRYVIGYYPTNQERSGESRSIITEVREHPEYKILGRKSYILTPSEKP